MNAQPVVEIEFACPASSLLTHEIDANFKFPTSSLSESFSILMATVNMSNVPFALGFVDFFEHKGGIHVRTVVKMFEKSKH